MPIMRFYSYASIPWRPLPVGEPAPGESDLGLLSPLGGVPALVVRTEKEDQAAAVGVADDAHEERALPNPELKQAVAELAAEARIAHSHPLLLENTTQRRPHGPSIGGREAFPQPLPDRLASLGIGVERQPEGRGDQGRGHRVLQATAGQADGGPWAHRARNAEDMGAAAHRSNGRRNWSPRRPGTAATVSPPSAASPIRHGPTASRPPTLRRLVARPPALARIRCRGGSGRTVVGPDLPDLPWHDRPKRSTELVWRYHANPIIDRNPDSEVARVFNSSVVPTSGGFVGAFRADHRNARPDRRRGRSADGLRWTLDPIVIPWQDEAGRAVPVTSPEPSGGPDLGLAAALGGGGAPAPAPRSIDRRGLDALAPSPSPRRGRGGGGTPGSVTAASRRGRGVRDTDGAPAGPIH